MKKIQLIFIQNLWNECINISKENGYELRSESKNLHEDLLFKSDYPFKASMLVDMEKKLITEHEHILFEFIKLGKKKKLNTSLLETCHLNMCIYEDNLNKIYGFYGAGSENRTRVISLEG